MASSNPLAGIADQIARIPETASLAAIKVVKEVAKKEAQKVAGADMRLSNLGRRGKLTTRDTFKAGTASTQVTVFAVPPAPWRWMTDGTQAHIIGGGRANRRTGNYAAKKVTAGKRLRIGGQWRTGPVFHPGTTGRNAWTNVRRESERLIIKAFEAEVKKVIS